MDNVTALKRLAVVVLGGKITVDDVPGTTVTDVINYIADNYKAPAQPN